MITDRQWAVMEPMVNQAKRHEGGQPPVLPDRMFFEALLSIARTGIPLKCAPGAGPPESRRYGTATKAAYRE
jgi:transposase